MKKTSSSAGRRFTRPGAVGPDDFLDLGAGAAVVGGDRVDGLAGAEAVDDDLGADAGALDHGATEAEARVDDDDAALGAVAPARAEVELEGHAGLVAHHAAQPGLDELLDLVLAVPGRG